MNRAAPALALHDRGVQFMVRMRPDNSKRLNGRVNKFSLILRDTILTLLKNNDLAVQCGSWLMPARDSSHVLIVADFDDIAAIPHELRHILANLPTFQMQTPSGGLHYYFEVPREFAAPVSKPGFGDWLGTGRIAVITGEGRVIANAAPIRRLRAKQAALLRCAFIPDERQYPRWHSGATYQRETFEAVAGERNSQINRFLVDDLAHNPAMMLEQLNSYALEYAAMCQPPYPAKEALSIAKSVHQNRDRILEKITAPRRESATATPALEAETDHRLVRLARYYPNVGDTFTLADYSAALEANDWKAHKSGYCETARTDIKHAQAAGEIEVAGKAQTTGRGRKPLVYRRVRECQFAIDYLMPGRETRKAQKQAATLAQLPDEYQEVVRLTLARSVGISVRTLNRYIKELKSTDNQWNTALIEVRWRGFKINTWVNITALPADMRREFIVYRPSLYRRTAAYHQLMAEQRNFAVRLYTGIVIRQHLHAIPCLFRTENTEIISVQEQQGNRTIELLAGKPLPDSSAED